MSASKQKAKVRCKNPKGSPQRVDERAGRTDDAQEKKWWVVEWKAPHEWRELNIQSSVSAESCADWFRSCYPYWPASDRWRVVEVVERRTVVKLRRAGSSIDEADRLNPARKTANEGA